MPRRVGPRAVQRRAMIRRMPQAIRAISRTVAKPSPPSRGASHGVHARGGEGPRSRENDGTPAHIQPRNRRQPNPIAAQVFVFFMASPLPHKSPRDPPSHGGAVSRWWPAQRRLRWQTVRLTRLKRWRNRRLPKLDSYCPPGPSPRQNARILRRLPLRSSLRPHAVAPASAPD